MPLRTFEFFIDEKVTVWNRSKYNVQAETLEEAKNIIFKEFEDPEYEEETGFQECETLFDTEEEISPQENGNQATRELVYYDGTKEITIKTNTDDNS